MVLMSLLTAAVVVNLLLTAAVFVKTCIPSADERTDRQVELAMEESQRPDPMDEGFENIMRFSVNGKTGFERDE